jgi:hypothetical protein
MRSEVHATHYGSALRLHTARVAEVEAAWTDVPIDFQDVR